VSSTASIIGRNDSGRGRRRATRLGRVRAAAYPVVAVKIILTRDASIPLRAQLALQIEVALVTGQIEPGAKLPSVRELARRLKLHHNTVAAAYGELAERGLIETRRGSGIYAIARSRPAAPDQAREIDELIATFLETARARGFSTRSIREAVRTWLERQPPDHVLIIEPAPDIRAILEHEIASALSCRVEASGLDALADIAALDGALLVTSFYHSGTVRDRVGASVPLVTISLNPGSTELERLLQLPSGSMLGVVSVSPILLSTVTTVIGSVRGEDVLVRPVPLSDEVAWRRLARTADAMVCDSLSGARVAPFTTRPMRVIRLVPDTTIDQLRHHLPSPTS
jgi:GntR family transcriptional regulator